MPKITAPHKTPTAKFGELDRYRKNTNNEGAKLKGAPTYSNKVSNLVSGLAPNKTSRTPRKKIKIMETATMIPPLKKPRI